MVKTYIFVFSLLLLLVPMVSAESEPSAISHAIAVDADPYEPPKASSSNGASDKKEFSCLTQWVTRDGTTWEARDLYKMKGTKKVVIDGNRCKKNESLAQARKQYATGYLAPLYTNLNPMLPSLLWK